MHTSVTTIFYFKSRKYIYYTSKTSFFLVGKKVKIHFNILRILLHKTTVFVILLLKLVSVMIRMS